MKNFALLGAAGFIAPRHMKAIKETGNRLVAALDPFDSVGIIDSYFPQAAFFTETERFDRHLDKARRSGQDKIDYLSICSPNYLHDAHIRLALRNEAHAICEKPIVLNPWNVEALQEIEKESGKNIFAILQLRHHETIRLLQQKVQHEASDEILDIELTYITSRGKWYGRSWKGDLEKSGGVATNIGIHFFDMLTWIFGDLQSHTVHANTHEMASGLLHLKNARVKWFLSLSKEDLPKEAVESGKTTYRSITLNGEELEFSQGFTELHTVSYKSILHGNGFRLSDARPSIEIAHAIRNAELSAVNEDYHPYLINKSNVVSFKNYAA